MKKICLFILLFIFNACNRSTIFEIQQCIGVIPSDKKLKQINEPKFPPIDIFADFIINLPYSNIIEFRNDSLIAIADWDEHQRWGYNLSNKWDGIHHHNYYLINLHTLEYKEIYNFETNKIWGKICYDRYVIDKPKYVKFQNYYFKLYETYANIEECKITIQLFESNINYINSFNVIKFEKNNKRKILYFKEGIQDYTINRDYFYFLSAYNNTLYRINVSKIFN
jgi:hypothetical protein